MLALFSVQPPLSLFSALTHSACLVEKIQSSFQNAEGEGRCRINSGRVGRTSAGMEDHTGAIPSTPGRLDPRNYEVPAGGSGVGGRVVKRAALGFILMPFPLGFSRPSFFSFTSCQ